MLNPKLRLWNALVMKKKAETGRSLKQVMQMKSVKQEYNRRKKNM
jgi:hypothetical protein